LQFLYNLDRQRFPLGATWFDIAEENSLLRVMPPVVDDALMLAKMRLLCKKGYVLGCYCGCRGDFEITAKGIVQLEYLGGVKRGTT
jgi:hypothetical protein